MPHSQRDSSRGSQPLAVQVVGRRGMKPAEMRANACILYVWHTDAFDFDGAAGNASDVKEASVQEQPASRPLADQQQHQRDPIKWETHRAEAM